MAAIDEYLRRAFFKYPRLRRKISIHLAANERQKMQIAVDTAKPQPIPPPKLGAPAKAGEEQARAARKL